MLYIYNTLTLQKEKFKPLKQDIVKVYYCGPTPYNYAHIGNLKSYIYEDYVIKTLRFLGYKVLTTMNITDIDDKTIRMSQEKGISLKKITKEYSNYFLGDLKKLGVNLADNIIPISTIVDEMIVMINGLIKKGYAYLGDDGSIYYEIKKFKKYGELAHLNFSGMKNSVRINNDEYGKENASDFALWKVYKKEDGENYRDGEFIFGDEKKIIKGRPGWHIECSACNLKYLGEQIDIHMGGVDNIFPHHQNEIAQTEAFTGKTFSKYWIHGGHVTIEGKKMSKSENNFYTLKDLEKKYKNIPKTVFYRALRYCFTNAKYRESVDFSFTKLESCINSINRIDISLTKLKNIIQNNYLEDKKPRKEFSMILQTVLKEFIEKLEDDFNMPDAFNVFFPFIKKINSLLDKKEMYHKEAISVLNLYETFNQTLCIFDFSLGKIIDFSSEILEKLEERNRAKKEKNYELADKIREELLKEGYKIIDDRQGTRLEKI